MTPAATAVADPPEDPPEVNEVSQGLRVGPPRRSSVVGRMPNSGILVRPTGTKPAGLSRLIEALSWSGTWSLKRLEPIRMGLPLSGVPSFTVIGTPAKGRGSSGEIVSAAASALSASTTLKALMRPS